MPAYKHTYLRTLAQTDECTHNITFESAKHDTFGGAVATNGDPFRDTYPSAHG
jgi:hypothetical protein